MKIRLNNNSKTQQLIFDNNIFNKNKKTAGFYCKSFINNETLNKFYTLIKKSFNITEVDADGNIYVDDNIKIFKAKVIDDKYMVRIKYNEYSEYN